MSKAKLVTSLLIVAVTGVLVVWFFAQSPKDEPSTRNDAAQDSVDTSPTNTKKLIIGDADAPVTIIEYGDFQCPICKRFFEQTEPALISKYIDTNKVKIEFRVETHLGEESIAAGEAAYCANDQNAFRAFHNELYRAQSGINSGAFSNENLKLMAKKLNLDTAKFNNCLDNGAYRQVVIDSNAEAQERGVTATPTFFIGEQKIVGAQPLSIFEPIINGQL